MFGEWCVVKLVDKLFVQCCTCLLRTSSKDQGRVAEINGCVQRKIANVLQTKFSPNE